MINIGGNIGELYVGSTPIDKAYIGSQLVWEKSSPALPYDAQVMYLGSTGTQVLDTGIAFTDNFTWEIKFKGCVRNTSILGGRNSSTRTCCLFFYGDTSHDFTIPIAQSNGASTPFQLSDLSQGVHTIKATIASNSGSVWIDGVQQYSNQSFSGTYISGVSCALFCSKYGDNDYREHTTTKIFSFKMWQGNTLVRDFIPVRVGDVGYLYDKVSETLFGNVGTGSFVVGPDSNTYDAQVEWLATDGVAYINTGLNPKNTTRVEIVMDAPTLEQTTWFFGARNSASAGQFGVINDLSTWQWRFGNKNAQNSTAASTGIYTFDNHTSGASRQLYIKHGNTTLTLTATNNKFTCNYNMFLFTLNVSGAVSSTTIQNGLKCISAKIWDGTTLVRDYIPVRKNGVGYLWDNVTEELYGNARDTGAFTYGNDVN